MDKLTSAEASAKLGEAPGPRPRAHPKGTSPERTSAVSAPNTSPSLELGVYVHFPWCLSKCPYCDFLSIPSDKSQIPGRRYADAVLREVAARRAVLGPVRLASVFFGGGTPSLWAPQDLGRVLRAILEAFESGTETPEITVECNPSSLTRDHARALLDVGVNRLSIGVQGLNDERLQFLGRRHNAEQALHVVREALASGMPRVSADLIYGVVGQSPESAAEEAQRLVELGLTHLSAYALTIEPQTQFGALARKGRLPQAPEEAVAECFESVDARLSGLGFAHYEISNFARPGAESRHNLGYWRGVDYVGLGCGAWGAVPRAQGRVRYRNRPQADGYMQTAERVSAETLLELESEAEELTAEMQLSEALMLGLRLAEGLDVARAQQRTGAEMWTRERRRAADRLVGSGRLLERGSRLSIPRSSWLFADGIIAALM